MRVFLAFSSFVACVYVVLACIVTLADGNNILFGYGEKKDIPSQDGVVDYYIAYKNGSHEFGYDTGSGEHQSFRKEFRDSSAVSVVGFYGELRSNDTIQMTTYRAGLNGYNSETATFKLSTGVNQGSGRARFPSNARNQGQVNNPLIVGYDPRSTARQNLRPTRRNRALPNTKFRPRQTNRQPTTQLTRQQLPQIPGS